MARKERPARVFIFFSGLSATTWFVIVMKSDKYSERSDAVKRWETLGKGSTGSRREKMKKSENVPRETFYDYERASERRGDPRALAFGALPSSVFRVCT